jgi:undecaprenyl-diphosphatase
MNYEVLIIQYIQENLQIFGDILQNFSQLFNIKLFLVILLILYSIKYITGKQILILFLGQLIIFGIKSIIKRPRPFENNNNIKLLEKMNIDKYSFPSGHTFSALMITHFIYLNTGTYYYLIPIITGLARMYLGVHYPTDLLGSYLIYYLIKNYIL